VPSEPSPATPSDVGEVTGGQGAPVQIRPSRLVAEFIRTYSRHTRASKRAIPLRNGRPRSPRRSHAQAPYQDSCQTARAREPGQSRGQTPPSHPRSARQPWPLRTDGTPAPRTGLHQLRAWPGRDTQASLPPRRAVTDRRLPGRGRQPAAGPGPLSVTRGTLLGHAEALNPMASSPPGRRRQSRPTPTAATPGTEPGPCHNSGRRASRPTGDAAPELVLPARRCRPAFERPCSACRTQERFSARTTRRPRASRSADTRVIISAYRIEI
jgi:hypothetical protein